ncbi:hypothetical protein [Flavobacterium sp.]|uniref:hypothetical protein n=1 Tax=Flavobacterium sp. TaxID=239 RepID=UPI0008D66CB8|nr:hypothetical protein [Flavobacterium sp.]OGS63266.1 MAG: hypothetical protein A2X07_04325 [Flavobacteria bacterium GWF1_32_7]HBD25783.1 hypothetical protein [Flavobacterium sp.]
MKKYTFLSLILVTFSMIKCSIPNATMPKFEKDNQETILTELKSIGNFEKVAINGSVISSGNDITDILVVQLLNGKEINGDKNQMLEIGKQVMKLTINSIENENEYDKFQVVFIQQAKKGMVTKSFSMPIEFTLGDLK